MSAIHRALSETSQREADSRSGFNPLQAPTSKPSQRAWWWLSLALMVAIVLVSGQRFRSTTLSEPPGEASVEQSSPSPAPITERSQLANQSAPTEATETTAQPPAAIMEDAFEPTDARSTDALPSLAAVAPPELPEREQPPAASQEQAPATAQARASEPQSEPAPRGDPEPAARAEQPAEKPNTEGAPASAAAVEPPAQPNRNIVTPSAPTYESRVEAAIADQDLPRAKQWLHQWISEEPEHDVPRVWLARIYLAEDQLVQAQGLLQGQRSIEARALVGLVHERSGEFQQAAILYEALAREDPSNAQWWLRWAINLENSGQLAQARNLYQTYLQLFPGQNSSLTRFAQQRYQSLEGQP